MGGGSGMELAAFAEEEEVVDENMLLLLLLLANFCEDIDDDCFCVGAYFVSAKEEKDKKPHLK
jgi:hypothetical protein